MGDRYQLIAGERRWRAAQRAALGRVPVVVRHVTEDPNRAFEMTLVENLQREVLNPIEQARAFEKLTDAFHLTQEQVAERTGKDRATIANSVRLLSARRRHSGAIRRWPPNGRTRTSAARNCGFGGATGACSPHCAHGNEREASRATRGARHKVQTCCVQLPTRSEHESSPRRTAAQIWDPCSDASGPK